LTTENVKPANQTLMTFSPSNSDKLPLLGRFLKIVLAFFREIDNYDDCFIAEARRLKDIEGEGI
jgi:hypothetical protein